MVHKGRPGLTQSDLLIVNTCDLADAVGAQLGSMQKDTKKDRIGAPNLFVSVKEGTVITDIRDFILGAMAVQPDEEYADTDESN